jgi:hypothetical protein
VIDSPETPPVAGVQGNGESAAAASADSEPVARCAAGRSSSSDDADLSIEAVGVPRATYDGVAVVEQSTDQALVLDLEPSAGAVEPGVRINTRVEPLPVLATGLKLWLTIDLPADAAGSSLANGVSPFAWSLSNRQGGELLLGSAFDMPVGAIRALDGTDLCAEPTYYCGYAGEQLVFRRLRLQADDVLSVDHGQVATVTADGYAYEVQVRAWRNILASTECGGAARDQGPHYRFDARAKASSFLLLASGQGGAPG